MDDFDVPPTKIPRLFDFDQITRAIMGEEAWGLVFMECRIKREESGEQYNEAHFAFSADGSYPKACIVQATTDAIPSGYQDQWTGLMIVRDQVRDVRLVRIK